MKRFCLPIAVALALGFAGGNAVGGVTGGTAARSASETLGDYIAPPGKKAKVHVTRCSRSGRYCWVHVNSGLHCRVLVQQSPDSDGDWVWAKRLRCR